ncbi:MAG: lipoprotein-anchoring transpeptidase ErfK/SrfK [Crocinitomicaceae bacterium]|jgi:lipoprotein-anchoring transpeptidase ErfK/SrfK
MNINLHIRHVLALLLVPMIFSSCTTGVAPKPNPKQSTAIKGIFVNPYNKGTYAYFTASSNYPKTYRIYRNEVLLTSTDGSNAKVIVDLSLQRGFLLNDGKVAMDYPVSTGNKNFPTPAGKYEVLKKKKSEKRSNLYGKIYDAEDIVVKINADSSKDIIPEGGRFEGALMSSWMRISWDGIGMHQGKVPRYPASHGCIRTYYKAVDTVFAKVAIGTPVVVR